LDGELLAHNLQQIRQRQNPAREAVPRELVQKEEEIFAEKTIYSVTQKLQVPPSGSKNDYMSMGPYWWPDPSKADAKPYIRKDGERNPEIKGITDHSKLGKLEKNAELLGLACYYNKDEIYVRHAARILGAWFLDESTRMNPNLNFGQGIPCRTQGRGIGIIETRELYRMIDAAILLQKSSSWTSADHQGLKMWFSEYLTWLNVADRKPHRTRLSR
jgi:hypothetical protein